MGGRPGISLQQASAALTPVSIQIPISSATGRPCERDGPQEAFESRLELERRGKGISFLRARYSKAVCGWFS